MRHALETGNSSGISFLEIRSAQARAVPSGVTRSSYRSGGVKSIFVSSKRPAEMRSSQIVKAGPNASLVSAVGQTKSAMAVPPAFTTWSHNQPIRLACSIRSSIEKPRSRLRLARTSSALKMTALISGASSRVKRGFACSRQPHDQDFTLHRTHRLRRTHISAPPA